MKKLILLLLVFSIAGCAYSETYVQNSGSGNINVSTAVEKPTAVNPAIQGNIPLQGGTVTSPTNSVGK